MLQNENVMLIDCVVIAKSMFEMQRRNTTRLAIKKEEEKKKNHQPCELSRYRIASSGS